MRFNDKAVMLNLFQYLCSCVEILYLMKSFHIGKILKQVQHDGKSWDFFFIQDDIENAKVYENIFFLFWGTFFKKSFLILCSCGEEVSTIEDFALKRAEEQ